jgi:hypothetical protein
MNKEKLESKIKEYLNNKLISSRKNYRGISEELLLEKLICFSLEFDLAFRHRFNAHYFSKNIGRKILYKYDVMIKDKFWKKKSSINKLTEILVKLEMEIQEFESRISMTD